MTFIRSASLGNGCENEKHFYEVNETMASEENNRAE